MPHGWESGLLYEETTRTLFAADLFTALGRGPAITDDDIVEPAIAAENASRSTAITPTTGSTIRRLARLDAGTLALMHAPAFTGDAAEALRGLADDYDHRLISTTEGGTGHGLVGLPCDERPSRHLS